MGLFAVLGVLGVLLVRDGLAARSALQAARSEVGEARQLLAEGKVRPARQRLQAADRQIDRAGARTDRVLWSALGAVPVLGRSADTVRGVLEVAEAAVVLGLQATEQAGGLLGEDGDASIRSAGGRLDLGRLRAAHQALQALPVSELEEARGELAAVPEAWVPGSLRRAREQTLGLAGRGVGLARDAGRLLDVLGPFLGGQGPRRYLLVMQNPAELRGTGGIPGYVSVLRARRGRLELAPPRLHTTLNVSPTAEDPTPVDAPEAFLDRYGAAGANSLFVNVNLDPDLPTTAPVMLDLYEERTGERLDGVLIVDPVALEQMFQLIGPLDIPDEVADPGGRLPDPIPAGKIAEITTIQAYEVFGGRNPDRRAYLEQLSLAAFRQLLASDWDAAAMGRRLARVSGSRHLQLYSAQAAEQKAFRQLGVAGQLQPVSPPSDLLAITANNAGANKMDVHLGHRFNAEMDLQLPDEDLAWSSLEEVDRQATVRATVRNPLPSSGRDEYIIGSMSGPRQEGGTRSVNGLARTWLSLWTPDGTGLPQSRTDDGPAQVATGALHGHTAFDYFLETPSESTTWWEADVVGPVPVSVEDGRLVYRLTWWRQAKAIPDHLDLTVRVPDGWRIADASLAGGGRAAGMGVWSNGEPVQLDRGADSVAVVGTATTDVSLQLEIVPDEGIFERIREGLIP